jgi:hypothetical protein
MLELVQDDERLREERKKAKKNREKYVGLDSETASSSRYSSSSNSNSYNDYNRNNSSSISGGFPKSSTTSAISHALDDKEWRSNNPSIQERITDITSKVKNMFDVPDIENNKAGLSEDEDRGGRNNGHSKNGGANSGISDFAYSKESSSSKAKNNSSTLPAKIEPIPVRKEGSGTAGAAKSKTVDNIAKLNIKLNSKKVI